MQPLGMVVRQQEADNNHHIPPPIICHRCGQMGHSALECTCCGQKSIQLENQQPSLLWVKYIAEGSMELTHTDNLVNLDLDTPLYVI